jgi:hypothetical protein
VVILIVESIDFGTVTGGQDYTFGHIETQQQQGIVKFIRPDHCPLTDGTDRRPTIYFD